MKKLKYLILFLIITVSGAILPMKTALAIGELTYYVPIVPCRLFDTRSWNKTAANPQGQPEPFVATNVRSGTVMYETRNLYINEFTAVQGGNIKEGLKCELPNTAVAIHINLTATSPQGGDSWLRVWPYEAELEANVDGARATVMSWNGSQLGNALPLTITPLESGGTIGFNFTIRVFFQTVNHPTPEDNSVHIVGDALGYYVAVPVP